MKRLQLVEDEYNLIHDCSDLEVAQARLLGRQEMLAFIIAEFEQIKKDYISVSTVIYTLKNNIDCEGTID